MVLDILQFERGGIVPEQHLGFDPDMSSRDNEGVTSYYEGLRAKMKGMVEAGTDRTPSGLKLHEAIDKLEQEMDEKQI